jgi:hypothetical protein
VRSLALALVLTVVATTAHGETLHVSATAGMLQEWELTAELAASGSKGQSEYAGPAVLKHVGLCSSDGPEQKTGELRLRPSRWSMRLDATLSYEGHVCSFVATRGGSASGVMDCRDAHGIPITVSVQ